MADIGKLWAGRAYGTNTGNLFAELDTEAGPLTGTLRFLDANFGLAVYTLTGTFDGSVIELNGSPTQSQPGVILGDLSAKASLTPSGFLRGQWQTSAGTAGTFELFPHDIQNKDAAAQSEALIPEQLHTQRTVVGAVRLYSQDIRSLAQIVKKDFTIGRVVVTYRADGIENTRYLEDFEIESSKLGKLDYFRLNIQELEAHGINKNVAVELNAQGTNQITVQGIYESWVIGKAEFISRQLRHHEKQFVTTFKKWGVTINQIVFTVMLLVAPEIHSIERRFIFAGIVIALLVALFVLHNRFIPTVAIYLTPRAPSFWEKTWPSILSWLIAVTAALAASYAFYLLSGHQPA